MSFSPDTINHRTPREKLQAQKAEDITEKMEEALKLARSCLVKAQESMKRQADKHRRDEDIQVGDEVYLNREHIKADRPSLKLDDKNFGPYKVLEAKEGSTYRVDIPEEWPINNHFHTSRLYMVDKKALPG